MKLRNKRTGEIIDIYKGEIILHYNQGRKTMHFKRLEDLEEWEDYEEPKGYWYYDTTCCRVEKLNHNKDKEIDSSIGNCFETREEAERAVEKLKAWKRLKDKGFYFKKWSRNQTGTINIFCMWEGFPHNKCVREDLDLLFGGEE